MIQSMTAFARHSGQESWGEFVWEVRSVNQRYLDLSIRLPEIFREFEQECRERARSTLSRGKVECFLKVTPGPAWHAELRLNQSLLTAVIAACRQVADISKTPMSLDHMTLLQWPGVVISSELEASTLKNGVMDGFNTCMKKFVESREREGQTLEQLLRDRLHIIDTETQKISDKQPQILQNQLAKIRQRFDQLKIEIDNNRLEQELVLLAQKIDIAEEIDRLNSHVKEILHILNEGGVVGRRLDFLIQELHREANTIASKSQDAGVSASSIELKVAIEQMREQVQNIE